MPTCLPACVMLWHSQPRFRSSLLILHFPVLLTLHEIYFSQPQTVRRRASYPQVGLSSVGLTGRFPGNRTKVSKQILVMTTTLGSGTDRAPGRLRVPSSERTMASYAKLNLIQSCAGVIYWLF